MKIHTGPDQAIGMYDPTFVLFDKGDNNPVDRRVMVLGDVVSLDRVHVRFEPTFTESARGLEVRILHL